MYKDHHSLNFIGPAIFQKKINKKTTILTSIFRFHLNRVQVEGLCLTTLLFIDLKLMRVKLKSC